MNVSPNNYDPRPRVTILMAEMAEISDENFYEVVSVHHPDPETDFRLPG